MLEEVQNSILANTGELSEFVHVSLVNFMSQVFFGDSSNGHPIVGDVADGDLEKIRFDKMTKFPLEEKSEAENELNKNLAIYIDLGIAFMITSAILIGYFSFWYANKSLVQNDGTDILKWLHRTNV